MAARNDWSSGVKPHGALTQIAPSVWWVKGSMKPMPLPRNMVVVRLGSGELVLHSVVCMDEAEMSALEALGTPRWMIVPSPGHRLDAPRYKARYPDLTVLAPSGARAKVEEVVAVDATCEEALPALGIACHAADGMKDPSAELAYEVDAGDGKGLVLNDVLANGPKLGGVSGRLFNLLGSGGRFGTARFMRWVFVRDKRRLRAWVSALADAGPWSVITVSHGDPVTDRCGEALREAAARL